MKRAVDWSARFALHGPKLIPMVLRKLPLRACILVYVVRFKLGVL